MDFVALVWNFEPNFSLNLHFQTQVTVHVAFPLSYPGRKGYTRCDFWCFPLRLVFHKPISTRNGCWRFHHKLEITPRRNRIQWGSWRSQFAAMQGSLRIFAYFAENPWPSAASVGWSKYLKVLSELQLGKTEAAITAANKPPKVEKLKWEVINDPSKAGENTVVATWLGQ